MAELTCYSHYHESSIAPLPDWLILGGNDAGSIDHAFKGKGGTPVIVLEEFHNSRASQIQHAITLVRLYQRQRVRTLGLEGYLKERQELTVSGSRENGGVKLPLQNARVAIRFLAEGEISEAAKFMKLVFDDFELYPIETASQSPTSVCARTQATQCWSWLNGSIRRAQRRSIRGWSRHILPDFL